MKCVLGGFQCPGYPLRLKFQDEGTVLQRKFWTRRPHGKSDHQAALPAVGPSPHNAQNTEVQDLPLSPSDKLVSCFCQLFSSDLSAGPNLAAFGRFINEIPLHMGHSRVLDLSVESLYFAHGAQFTKRKDLFVCSRGSYGKALQSLQQCLENEDQARASETLCATVLLGIYEVSGLGNF